MSPPYSAPALDNGKFLNALVDLRLSEMAVVAKNEMEADAKAKAEALKMTKSTKQSNKILGALGKVPDVKLDAIGSWAKSELGKTSKSLGAVLGKPHAANEESLLATMMDQKYEVTKVFVIFEHEKGQRHCLHELSNGLIAAWFDLSDMPKEHKFRGDNVLEVAESEEPSEVIWERLRNVTVKKQVVITIGVKCAVVVVFAVAVMVVGTLSSFFNIYVTAILISVLQELVPAFVRLTTDWEYHEHRSGISNAVMFRTFTFDILTGALAIYMFTSFQMRADHITLDQVQQILVMDCFAVPCLNFIQPIVKFKRKFMAPRTECQGLREDYYKGEGVSFGEMFAKVNGTVFIGMFYIALVPAGIVITCIALVICYWTSKHGLFRRWLRTPNFGLSLLPTAAIQTFFAILASLIMSTQFYAGWPFDNVCAVDNDPNNGFYICDKEPAGLFDVQAKEWMGADQKLLVEMFKWTSVGFGSGLGCYWIFAASAYSVKALFFGHTADVGEDQGQAYTTVDEVQGFIPCITHEMLETPLIACDKSRINDEYLHFQAEYDLYDIFTDAKELATKHEKEFIAGNIFSTCTYYPTVDNPDPTQKVDKGDDSYGQLWVFINQATGLAAEDINGKSDPCCLMTYVKGKWKTKTCKGTVDPTFGEEYLVPVSDFHSDIGFALWDADMGRLATELGETSVSVLDIAVKHPGGGRYEDKFPIKRKDGSIKGGEECFICHPPLTFVIAVLFLGFEWIPNEANMAKFYAEHPEHLPAAPVILSPVSAHGDPDLGEHTGPKQHLSKKMSQSSRDLFAAPKCGTMSSKDLFAVCSGDVVASSQPHRPQPPVHTPYQHLQSQQDLFAVTKYESEHANMPANAPSASASRESRRAPKEHATAGASEARRESRTSMKTGPVSEYNPHPNEHHIMPTAASPHVPVVHVEHANEESNMGHSRHHAYLHRTKGFLESPEIDQLAAADELTILAGSWGLKLHNARTDAHIITWEWNALRDIQSSVCPQGDFFDTVTFFVIGGHHEHEQHVGLEFEHCGEFMDEVRKLRGHHPQQDSYSLDPGPQGEFAPNSAGTADWEDGAPADRTELSPPTAPPVSHARTQPPTTKFVV
jgi:hypothetical protein